MYTSLLTEPNSTIDGYLGKVEEKTLSASRCTIPLTSCFLPIQACHEKTLDVKEGLENTSSSQPRETIIPQAISALSKLEIYAYANTPEAFILLVESIDWSKQLPHTMIRAVDLALSLSLNTLAIELAQKGKVLFPDNSQLQKAAKVLREPSIQKTKAVSNRQLHVSREWLSKHAKQYKGKWVAVQAGNLIGVANSLDELRKTIGTLFNSENILITKVL